MYAEEFCHGCDRFDEQKGQKNRLYCRFKCEPYINIMSQRAYAYNKSVSVDDFSEPQYEHGSRVFGSGIEQKGGDE